MSRRARSAHGDRCALLLVALAACGTAPPPSFTLLPDPCAARASLHVEGHPDSVGIAFRGGFPARTVNGTLARNGHFSGVVASTPNGPGPGLSLRADLCVEPADAARLFAAVDRGEPEGFDARIDMQALPSEVAASLNCVAEVTIGPSTTAYPSGTCHFRDEARRVADLVFAGATSAADATSRCDDPSAVCSLQLAAGTVSHEHDAFPSLRYEVVLARDGHLRCTQGGETTSANVDGAARLVDWLAGGTRPDGVELPETDEPYAGVFVAWGDRVGFAPEPGDGGAVVTRYRSLQTRLPPTCRLP